MGGYEITACLLKRQSILREEAVLTPRIVEGSIQGTPRWLGYSGISTNDSRDRRQAKSIVVRFEFWNVRGGTKLIQAGASATQIQKAGGWKSDAFMV